MTKDKAPKKYTDCEVKGQCLQAILSRLLLDDIQHVEITLLCTSKTKTCRRRKRLIKEKGETTDAGSN